METPRHIGDVTRGSMSDYSMNAACRGKENQVSLFDASHFRRDKYDTYSNIIPLHI